ncbi:GIY-YIG nuclease family protein [Candidatus Kuenenbacteria bacterium]|nr:GIY-YIG nuclease family protein [Candidatus Kuenenbacteria bacterium]
MRNSEKIPTAYIVTNKSHTTLYVGVTSNLIGRIWQHKNKTYPKSFTARYNCNKLVYYESSPTMHEAIAFEKQLKNWKREWKIDLINKHNPDWEDLSVDWYDNADSGSSPE